MGDDVGICVQDLIVMSYAPLIQHVCMMLGPTSACKQVDIPGKRWDSIFKDTCNPSILHLIKVDGWCQLLLLQSYMCKQLSINV